MQHYQHVEHKEHIHIQKQLDHHQYVVIHLDIVKIHHGDKIMHSPYSTGGRTPIHHSIPSLNSGVFTLDTLLLQTEHTTDHTQLNDIQIVDKHHHHTHINYNSFNANAYLFKLDSSDAFIQDKMCKWLHINRGWCQMVCCILLSDELERLCAWYNTRDADNVNDDVINTVSGIDHHEHQRHIHESKINRVDSGNSANKNNKIDDRISKFLYQELIKYISKIRVNDNDSDWM